MPPDGRAGRPLSRRLGRHRGLAFGLFVGLCGALFALTPLGVAFERNVGLATLFRVRGAISPPPQVAVVAINDRASAALGLPPLARDWRRAIHGRLVENLVRRGAAVIVFDIDFRRPKEAADDLAFARAVAAADRVVLVETLTGKRQPVLDREGRQTGTVWMEQLLPPLPVLAAAAKGLAPFPLPKVETDVFEFWAFKPTANDAGTLPAVALQLFSRNLYPRWLELLQAAGGEPANTLPPHGLVHAGDVRGAMRTWRKALRDRPGLRAAVASSLASARSQGLGRADYRRLKVLADLYAGSDHRYLNFYGPPGTIPTIPYNAVITGSDPNVDPALLDFSGKVVFVGFSDLLDPGQPDRFHTVFTDDNGVDLSGVEIAATAFANLLTERSIEPADGVATVSLLFLFGFALGAGVYLGAAIVAVPLALAASGAYAYSAYWLFAAHDYWLPLATPLLIQLPIALFVGLLAQYLLERRQHRRMNKAVSYYLPERVARQLTETEIDPAALNKVVYGVCLATDMSGFTRLSQSLSPTELADFMNAYFEALARALKQHRVDVTEFHADTVMCAWTAADAAALQRRDALLAALAVVAAVAQFKAARPGLQLNARVGLDEGHFFLGHTGGGGRMGYSILGDCANTAARLEGLNKILGTHVLASAAAVEGTDGLLLRPLGRFLLVGKDTPTAVVEVMAELDGATPEQREICRRFAGAIEAFQGQQWARARELFEALSHDRPDDGPARFYSAYCRAEPPQADDPTIIVMTSKS